MSFEASLFVGIFIIMTAVFALVILTSRRQRQCLLKDGAKGRRVRVRQGNEGARMQKYRDVAEIERFARAGVTLTRHFKFGHR